MRGIGPARALHALQLQQAGYSLAVHPAAFLVHRWHPPSAVRAVRNGRGFGKTKVRPDRVAPTLLLQHTVDAMAALMEAVRAGEGSYAPALDPGTEACRRILPWWSGSGR